MEDKQKSMSCAVCGTKADKKCTGCKQVYYCDREHQKDHWKDHKKECAKMMKQRNEEEMKPFELECAVCGISESSAHLKLCASCQMVAYCSKDHQRQHWMELHRSRCSEAEGLRVGITYDFAATQMLKSEYPQFQGDPRFQQLEQDLLDGAKRTWLRHALELLFFVAENTEGGSYQCNIGKFYINGYGVKQDAEIAAKWWHRAADQGEPVSQSTLGNCYDQGVGVPKNSTAAVKWWNKAADNGYADAQCNLGSSYENGGVQKDMIKAVKWYRKAVDQGHALAQANLGLCYAKGKGVPKDLNEAVKLFRKAAEQGNTNGQFLLGGSYLQGTGVPKDKIKAREWLQKAADQGFLHAINVLNDFDNHD